MTVARYAPGLFVATHKDGSAISAGAPAAPQERITLYGTGWGRFIITLADGFRVPATPPYPLADPVQVRAGDRVLESTPATATPGSTGVTALEVQLPSDVNSGVTLSITVVVGGVQSNIVEIPVR